jgi:thioredoxin 1
MLKLTSETFNEFVDSDELTLVDFYADWCGPCKMIAPLLESVQSCQVAKVDIDAEPELAKRFSVNSIPTMLFYRSGVVVEKLVGLQTKASLEGKIKTLSESA